MYSIRRRGARSGSSLPREPLIAVEGWRAARPARQRCMRRHLAHLPNRELPVLVTRYLRTVITSAPPRKVCRRQTHPAWRQRPAANATPTLMRRDALGTRRRVSRSLSCGVQQDQDGPGRLHRLVIVVDVHSALGAEQAPIPAGTRTEIISTTSHCTHGRRTTLQMRLRSPWPPHLAVRPCSRLGEGTRRRLLSSGPPSPLPALVASPWAQL